MVTKLASRDLVELGGFLSGTDYNGASLQSCLQLMAHNLASEVGSAAKARGLILQSVPRDKQAIVAAMLPKGARGRPKGSRVDDAAYRKAYALYDVYAYYWRKRGKAEAAVADLAEIKTIEPESVKRQLVRAKRRITTGDRDLIERAAIAE